MPGGRFSASTVLMVSFPWRWLRHALSQRRQKPIQPEEVRLAAELIGHHDPDGTHTPVRTHSTPSRPHPVPPKLMQNWSLLQATPSAMPPTQRPPHVRGSKQTVPSTAWLPPKQVPPQSASVSHWLPGTAPPTQNMHAGSPSQEPGMVPEHVPDCGVSQIGLQLETTVPLAPPRHSSPCDRHRPSPLQLPAASATA